MKEFIDKKLAAFGYGKIKDLLAIVKILETEKISMDALAKWIDEQEAATIQAIEDESKEIGRVLEKFAICPDCGAQMELIPIMSGSIRTRFSCTKCDLALDSTEPPSKFLQKFILKEKEEDNVKQLDPKKQK